jgi:hypothetical protein
VDSQVQRVVQWREQKRRAGYQPLTVWLKTDIKHRIEDLAAQQRVDCGQVVTTAILTLTQATAKRQAPAPPDYRLLERLIDERLAVKLPPLLQQEPSPEALALEALPRLGEWGALRKAVQVAARKLRRFRMTQMAREVGAQPSQVWRVLKLLVKKGELHRSGVIYRYIEESG